MESKPNKSKPRGWSDDERRVLCKVYPGGERKAIEKAVWAARPPWRRKRMKWDAIRKMAQRLGLRLRP